MSDLVASDHLQSSPRGAHAQAYSASPQPAHASIPRQSSHLLYSLPPLTAQSPSAYHNYSYSPYDNYGHHFRQSPVQASIPSSFLQPQSYSVHNSPEHSYGLLPSAFTSHSAPPEGEQSGWRTPSPEEDLRTFSPSPSHSYLSSPPKSPPKMSSRKAPIQQQQAPVQLPTSLQLAPAGIEADANLRCTDFVAKLWFLLDRTEYSKHIRWTDSGETFIFFPTAEFANEVLSRLFKHSNVASFVRQLNLYGFQRISHLEMLEDVTPPVTPDDAGLNSAPAVLQQQYEPSSVPPSGFMHPDFVRGKPNTLGRIRPKTANRNRKPSAPKPKKRARAQEDEDEEDERLPSRRRI